MMKNRWWREPFVHFVALGALLFATAPWWSADTVDDSVIAVSAETQQRLNALWEIEALRPPGAEDRAAILADHVREEALVREATRLGLADGDTVVRRRLAQKMTELIHDTVALDEPDDAALKAWFAKNAQRFNAPERRSFVHVFFKDNADVAARVANARAQLNSGSQWQQLGDAFIEKRSYSDMNQGEVTRIFGREFAERLFAVSPKAWQGPLSSALGTHLVRVVSIAPAVPAQFEAEREAIRAGYLDEKRREANSEAVNKVLARYEVSIAE